MHRNLAFAALVASIWSIHFGSAKRVVSTLEGLSNEFSNVTENSGNPLNWLVNQVMDDVVKAVKRTISKDKVVIINMDPKGQPLHFLLNTAERTGESFFSPLGEKVVDFLYDERIRLNGLSLRDRDYAPVLVGGATIIKVGPGNAKLRAVGKVTKKYDSDEIEKNEANWCLAPTGELTALCSLKQKDRKNMMKADFTEEDEVCANEEMIKGRIFVYMRGGNGCHFRRIDNEDFTTGTFTTDLVGKVKEEEKEEYANKFLCAIDEVTFNPIGKGGFHALLANYGIGDAGRQKVIQPRAQCDGFQLNADGNLVWKKERDGFLNKHMECHAEQGCSTGGGCPMCGKEGLCCRNPGDGTLNPLHRADWSAGGCAYKGCSDKHCCVNKCLGMDEKGCMNDSDCCAPNSKCFKSGWNTWCGGCIGHNEKGCTKHSECCGDDVCFWGSFGSSHCGAKMGRDGHGCEYDNQCKGDLKCRKNWAGTSWCGN